MPAGQRQAQKDAGEGDAGTDEHMWRESLLILIWPISLGLGSKQEEC